MLDNFPIDKTQITGAILAGGRATRMGGIDKGLLTLNGVTLVEQVIANLRPQVGQLLISANRNIEQYTKLGACPVLVDTFGHYDGPLAGMATALAAAKTNYIVFVPCDSPLFSSKLVTRLYDSLIQNHAEVSVADDGKRIHPVFSLFQRNLLANLLEFLELGKRGIHSFIVQQNLVKANFSDIPETFLNINTPEEHTALTIQLYK
jgi:molybdopterin-guanine dinucleotide biosynthesis protein A